MTGNGYPEGLSTSGALSQVYFGSENKCLRVNAPFAAEFQLAVDDGWVVNAQKGGEWKPADHPDDAWAPPGSAGDRAVSGTALTTNQTASPNSAMKLNASPG